MVNAWILRRDSSRYMRKRFVFLLYQEFLSQFGSSMPLDFIHLSNKTRKLTLHKTCHDLTPRLQKRMTRHDSQELL